MQHLRQVTTSLCEVNLLNGNKTPKELCGGCYEFHKKLFAGAMDGKAFQEFWDTPSGTTRGVSVGQSQFEACKALAASKQRETIEFFFRPPPSGIQSRVIQKAVLLGNEFVLVAIRDARR